MSKENQMSSDEFREQLKSGKINYSGRGLKFSEGNNNQFSELKTNNNNQIQKQPDIKEKKKRNDPEHKLQVQAVRIFRIKYPKIKYHLHAIPNGGLRIKSVGKKLKAEGCLSGVFDLFLTLPKKQYHGLYIETKYGDNKLTQEQKDFKTMVESVGYKTGVYYTVEEFIEIIEEYLKD